MSTITVLAHPTLCPRGMVFEAKPGDNLLVALLKKDIPVEHACEMQCACSTCHVYLRAGKDSVNPASAKEEAMLDQAWGLDLDSRLSCQVSIGENDLTVEIPKYSAHY